MSKRLLVHRCKFVDFVPSAVTSLAVSNYGYLAAARANGCVELYKIQPDHSLLLHDRIWTGATDLRRVGFLRAPKHCKRPLHIVTAGLDCHIRIFYIPTHEQVAMWNAGVGGIWDMIILDEDDSSNRNVLSNTCVAVSGEDGTVKLHFIPVTSTPEVLQLNILPHQITLRGANHRLVSLGTGKSADNHSRWIWAGSGDGQLYRWDMTYSEQSDTGYIVSPSPTSVIQVGKKVIPWCIKVLPDKSSSGHILFVGDSEGNLTIWDGAFGTRIQQLHHHQADILQIALDSNNSCVYCAGVDNAISIYSQAAPKGNSWVFSSLYRPHTHDILALAASKTLLFSGGIDTRIVVAELSSRGKHPGRVLMPWSQKPIASLVSRGNPNELSPAMGASGRLLVQLPDVLQIWRLGKPLILATKSQEDDSNKDKDIIPYDVLEEHALLLEIQPKLNKGEAIECSAISPLGSVVALSTRSDTKVFYLASNFERQIFTEYNNVNHLDDLLHVKKKRIINGPSAQLALTRTGFLIRAAYSRLIEIYNVSYEPVLVHTFDNHVVQQKDDGPFNITHIAISQDEQWLATADSNGFLNIFNLDTLKYHSTLPQFDTQIVALAFDNNGSHLAVATAGRHLHLWNVEQRRLSDFSLSQGTQPSRWKKLAHSSSAANEIIGASFSPLDPQQLILYGHSFVILVNIQDKKSKILKTFQSLQFADYLSDGSLVVVESSWQKILAQLPPAFYRKIFGT